MILVYTELLLPLESSGFPNLGLVYTPYNWFRLLLQFQHRLNFDATNPVPATLQNETPLGIHTPT